MMMMIQQHYGRALGIEQKAGKSDLEKTQKTDMSKDFISKKSSGNQKDGWVSMIHGTFFLFLQDLNFIF